MVKSTGIPHNLDDLTGRRFGDLTVIGRAGSDPHGHALWRCRGDDRREEVLIKLLLTRPWRREPEKMAWRAMLQRCRPGGHPDYGGRGIRVCDRWKSYETFLQDVGRRPSPKHSLDRIDNEGNYEPGNVRWATRKEQTRNTRGNRMLEYEGRTMTLVAWAEEVGLTYAQLRNRLKYGWTLGQALGFELRNVRRGRPPKMRERSG